MLRLIRLACAVSTLALLARCGGGTSTPPPQPLSIVTSSLADAFVNFAYTQTIQAKGGTPPFIWTVSSGNLPHGVALGSSSTNSVTISGTPDTAQAAPSFTLQVADAANQTAGRPYTININNTGSADLQEIQGPVPAGTIEIQGVGAGIFNPDYWQRDTLNWVPDVRIPLLAAQPTGLYHNIYAPWPLEQANGWRLFYGGWDGQDVPFDQIFSVTTDFLSFANRDHIIANGEFLNVNNVNVQQLPDGSLHMICTGGQAANSGGDKPVYFSSPDGTTWNGTTEPYSALLTDVISIQGYAPFSAGNFNGANVLLRDNATWVLYFKDWNISARHIAPQRTPCPTFSYRGWP